MLRLSPTLARHVFLGLLLLENCALEPLLPETLKLPVDLVPFWSCAIAEARGVCGGERGRNRFVAGPRRKGGFFSGGDKECVVIASFWMPVPAMD